MQELTVLVITYNEERNIDRMLSSVSFADRIVVIDSFSSDSTLEIIARYPQAEIYQREFTSFAEQCNFGLEKVQSAWVLSLDADYILPFEAAAEIRAALDSGRGPFETGFDYCIEGKSVLGSILPPRVVLFLVVGARYVYYGDGDRLQTSRPPHRLRFRIQHDDRKPLRRWLQSQIRYAEQEADKLGQSRLSGLSLSDRVRKLLVVAPSAVFLLVYVLRGGFLSGWRGLFYALQRLTAELLLSLYLIERLIRNKKP